MQWKFDASGNITQTGDMIIAVSYTTGVPTVEVRIWVSKTTYNTVSPALFKFGSSFDGSTTSFGYASILSNSGTTAFGSGIANLSATPNNDTTFSTPWGSHYVGVNTQWGAQYQSLQFIEIGLNLTRMGIDPALYSSVLGSGTCQAPFSSIFFKSRSSHSFTSTLQDFVGPFNFLQPALDYTIAVQNLTCSNTSGTVAIQNDGGSYFTWSTADGNITATTTNSILVNKPGTYTVLAAFAQGCPVVRTDVVTVAQDTIAPVASFTASATTLNQIILHGGDTAASNNPASFGGSQGLLWNWSGPNGFSANVQNPITSNVSGAYQLILTEKRNGCTDTATNFVSLAILSSEVVLKAESVNSGVVLRWNLLDNEPVTSFEIERSKNGSDFETIGSVSGANANTSTRFSFTDNDVPAGSIAYRIKVNAVGEAASYSNIVRMNRAIVQSYSLVGANFSSTPRLMVSVKEAVATKIVVYSTVGQTAYAKQVMLQAGQNKIELPANALNGKLHIVSLYINNQLQFSGNVVL